MSQLSRPHDTAYWSHDKRRLPRESRLVEKKVSDLLLESTKLPTFWGIEKRGSRILDLRKGKGL